MMQHRLGRLLGLVWIVALAGCFAHLEPNRLPAGQPNPLVGMTRFGIAPTQTAMATIRGLPTQAFILSLPPEAAAALVAGLDGFNYLLVTQLQANPHYQFIAAPGPPPPGVFIVQCALTSIVGRRGYFMNTGGMMSYRVMPARGQFVMRTYDANAHLLDEFVVDASERGSIGGVNGPWDGILANLATGLAAEVGHHLDELTLMHRR